MAADAVRQQLVVNEPKLKVDLQQYTERHTFGFDAVLDEHISNDEVYRCRPDRRPRPCRVPPHWKWPAQADRAAVDSARAVRRTSCMLRLRADRQRQNLHDAGNLSPPPAVRCSQVGALTAVLARSRCRCGPRPRCWRTC